MGGAAFGAKLDAFHALLVQPSKLSAAARCDAMRSLVTALNVNLPGDKRKCVRGPACSMCIHALTRASYSIRPAQGVFLRA